MIDCDKHVTIANHSNFVVINLSIVFCKSHMIDPVDEKVKSKWVANACVVLPTADGNKIFIISNQAAKH